MSKKSFIAVVIFMVAFSWPALNRANKVSISSHDEFFVLLAALCGQAFEGKVVEDIGGDGTFSNHRLVMHIRSCSENVLHIPFHLGENRSRTWIITKTGSGLQLKHDHRHEDGSDDESTMYGGHTTAAGWANAQSFPADQYSKELFVRTGIPQAVNNTWHIYIYPGKTFVYRLTREGREFRVDFDLTKPIAPPPPPWGYK